MSWLIVAAMAALVFAAMWALGAPRAGREAMGAAILLGVAGYAFQASPGLSGAPKAAAQKISGDPAALVAGRQSMAGGAVGAGGNFLTIGDALARNGRFGDAAGVLLGAVDKNPGDAEAWLALANALVGHAEGVLTPPADYAYRQAMRAEPAHPGPPFFLGLAQAGSGRLEEARETWTRLLAASPADAPWRPDLEARLRALEAYIAQSGASGPGR